MTSPSDDLTTEAALRGLLALEVVKREERRGTPDDRSTVVVLGDAGLNANAIGVLTGKKPGAVRKALERAKRRED